MAIAKWSMYLCAVLFIFIGLGSLAVAVVPGVDEWVAEQTLDAAGFPDDEDEVRDVAVNAITDDDVGGVRTTAWILAATFLPTALLFIWCGRWFKSMEGGFRSMWGGAAQMAVNPAAVFPQPGPGTAAPGGAGATASPIPQGEPPVPKFGDPVLEPPDPTAGGIIS